MEKNKHSLTVEEAFKRIRHGILVLIGIFAFYIIIIGCNKPETWVITTHSGVVDTITSKAWYSTNVDGCMIFKDINTGEKLYFPISSLESYKKLK